MSNFVSAATYKLYIPNAGPSTVTISGDNAHVTLDGIGSPGVFRHYRPYPQADGGVDQGFRLQERNLVWRMLVTDTTEAALEDARVNLATFLKPHTEPMTLEVTRADGETRYLDVYVSGAVEWQQSRQQGLSYMLSVPLYAPDPLWYDPGPYQAWDPYSAANTGGFSSYNATDASFTLTYDGNWHEWPIIVITNDFEDLILDISPIGIPGTHEIVMTGYTTQVGDITYIDLRTKRAYRDSNGADVSGNITNDYWTQTRLYPSPLAASGDHTISATYTSKGGSASIGFLWRNRYLHL